MNKNLLRKLELFSPPGRSIINQYKRVDVFRCTHETHLHFHSAVSVNHVLKAKGCYPEGCIYFKWKCKKLDKGATCPKKFKHVGRACSSCRYFYDVKIIKRPEVILASKEFLQFQNDLKVFESWLNSNMGRTVDFSGTINSVKPRLYLIKTSANTNVVFKGFLLNFMEGWVNAEHFHDFIYVPVSSRLQERLHFAKGDSVCFRSVFSVTDGAIVLRNVRNVEVLESGGKCFWTESRARVAQQTGSILSHQEKKCYACDKGLLLNIQLDNSPHKGSRRMMFCLEGIKDPALCCYTLQKKLQSCDMLPENEEQACSSNLCNQTPALFAGKG